jgi:hypothetical protein
MAKKYLLYRHSALSVVKIYSYLSLWPAAFHCIFTAIRYFFALQYKGAFLRSRLNRFWKKIPVSQVDCPLDRTIPFKPEYISVYMDFATHWIRTQGFLLQMFGRRALPHVRAYIYAISDLYINAAGLYRVNMSTTDRPRYFARFQFISVHILDPHLLCIPSLHVMVAVRTYTIFADILRKLGGTAQFAREIENVRAHSIAITESVLYVKQHSVNCVAAALYAMRRLDPILFPHAEAERFTAALFLHSEFSPAEQTRLRTHIRDMYEHFFAHGEGEDDWRVPLLEFLRRYIIVNKS